MNLVESSEEIPDMTMREFMELSLLAMFNDDELHKEIPVVVNNNYYTLHMCVQYAQPAEDLDNLARKQ